MGPCFLGIFTHNEIETTPQRDRVLGSDLSPGVNWSQVEEKVIRRDTSREFLKA